MMDADGGYANILQLHVACLWMMSTPAYCIEEDIREKTSYDAMKHLGIRRRETRPQALVARSRCQARRIGTGETGSMSESQYER
jgi:hypothetical protein